MKKLIILSLLAISVASHAEMKNVIMYEKDVSTGKVIDNRPEATREYKEKWAKKANRYTELDKKKNLTKKEKTEKDRLAKEMMEEYQRTGGVSERTQKAQFKNAENDAINRYTSGDVPEHAKPKKKKSFLGL